MESIWKDDDKKSCEVGLAVICLGEEKEAADLALVVLGVFFI